MLLGSLSVAKKDLGIPVSWYVSNFPGVAEAIVEAIILYNIIVELKKGLSQIG